MDTKIPFNHDNAYKRGHHDYRVTIDQERLCDRVFLDRKMTAAYYRVWGVLMKKVCEHGNLLDIRLKTISELSGVSMSGVKRAVSYFESANFMVRQTRPHQDVKWMINPELLWKWFMNELPDWQSRYDQLREEFIKGNIMKPENKSQNSANPLQNIEDSCIIGQEDILAKTDDCWFDEETGEIYHASQS